MTETITFKIINYEAPEYQTAVALREEILRKPLGLTFLEAELEAEKDQPHIVGLKDGEVVATTMLAAQGNACKMMRVAVREDMQNVGIGSQMMAFCEAYAKDQGFQSIYCYARQPAISFYIKNQYIPEGLVFNKDTIPHLEMRKYLLWELTESQEEEKQLILDKLKTFDRQVLQIPPDMPSSAPLNYVIKLDNQVIGGINANLYFGQSLLHINQLFVDEKYRGQQLGTTLLKKVESKAKNRGVNLAHLNTFDWQGLDFYLKHGYEIFGVLDDCPPGHKRYYLKKKLL